MAPRPTLLPGRVATFTRPASDRLAHALAWSEAYVANGCRPPATWKKLSKR